MTRQRMPRRLVFYQRSAAHRGRRLLSLAFAFDREEDVYQFAAAAPYSYSRLQRHLAAWEKKAQGHSQVSREAIAQTTVWRGFLYFIRAYTCNMPAHVQQPTIALSLPFNCYWLMSPVRTLN